MKHQIRVISNLQNLPEGSSEKCSIEFTPYPQGRISLWASIRIWLRSFSCDYVVINSQLPVLLRLAALNLLFPFNRCRLISVDMLLGNVTGVKEEIKRWILIALLKKIHRHFLYFKDTTGYQRVYRIEKERFRFVSFKINSYQKVINMKTTDEGFIFAGGYSRRDYTTFLKAIQNLPYPITMISADQETLLEHGAYMDESLLNDRVTVLTEYNPDRYIEIMAASKLVVVPLRDDWLSPGGVSAYIDAMALGKCVIITSGKAVDGVLTDEMAIMVKPGDPEAMKEAIERAYNDSEMRQRIAKRGYDYAIKLGGEERLMKSIVEELLSDYLESGRSKQSISNSEGLPTMESQTDTDLNSTRQTGRR